MGRRFGTFLVIISLVQLGIIFYVKDEAQTARSSLVKYQRQACERGKLDRRDNADFQRAQTQYITKVTDANSVREDVKRAARKARKTFARTSENLSKRAKINCKGIIK